MKKVIKILKKYDRLISYSIAIISVTLYFFPKVTNPKLDIIITDFTDVYTIQKPIDGLSIKYFERDLKEDSLNLKILRIKLINNSRNNILTSHYDPNVSFGINFKNTTILGFNIVNFNDTYLKDNIFNSIDGNVLRFNKILFDSKRYVEFEVHILYNINKETTISVFGKIAGVDKLTISDNDKMTVKDWISLALWLIGIFAALYIIGLIANYIGLFIEYLKERIRRKYLINIYVKRFKSLNENRMILAD